MFGPLYTSGGGGTGNLNWRGSWSIVESYQENDQVSHNSDLFVCLLDHSASALNEPGVGISWNLYWSRQVDMITGDQKAALDGNSSLNALNPVASTTDSRFPTSDQKAALDGNANLSALSPVADQNDSRFPNSGEKAALAGTSGTPSGTNKYVTDNDSRMTNARTPTAHATSHGSGMSDAIAGIENLPAAGEKAALVGTYGFPSADNKYVTNGDSRLSNARTPTAHDLVSAYHPVAGLTPGHVVRASAADAFGFAAIQAGDLPDLSGTYFPTASHTTETHNGLDIDADTVDGSHASAFAAFGHNHDATYAPLSHNQNASTILAGTFADGDFEFQKNVSIGRGDASGYKGYLHVYASDALTQPFLVWNPSYGYVLSCYNDGTTDFASTVKTLAGYVDAKVGFRINSAAANGQFLVGDGTKFSGRVIAAADLPAHASYHERNGSQEVDGLVPTYTSVALAEAASGEDDELCWVAANFAYYRYSSTSGEARDGLYCLNTAAGGNSRWLAIGGKYTFNDIRATNEFKRRTQGTYPYYIIHLYSGTTDYNIGLRYNSDASMDVISGYGDLHLVCGTSNVLDAAKQATYDATGYFNVYAGFKVAGAATDKHVLIGDGTKFAGRALLSTDIPDLSDAYQVVSAKAQASGYASLDTNTLVVQNPANATATPTASKIAIADTGGKLDSWITSATTGALGLIKLANHLGGTALLPTVIGIQETGGPTSLIVGAIADGKFTKRSGSTFIGASIAYGDLPDRISAHLWNSLGLEINYYGTGDRYAILDLHGDDTYTDFAARLMRNPGVNGSTDFTHRGTDGFRIIVYDAGYAGFYTNNTARAYVNSSGHFYAAANDTYTCGIAGTVWKEGRFTDVYTHDGGVHTSDAKKKIVGDLTLGLDFLMRLKPRQGKWKDYEETLEFVHPGQPIKTRDPKTGRVTLTPVPDTIETVKVQRTFKRTHCWFVAQEVKQAIVESGHSPDDIALYVKEANTDEGLRYAEFEPVFAKALQEFVIETRARLDKLEAA